MPTPPAMTPRHRWYLAVALVAAGLLLAIGFGSGWFTGSPATPGAEQRFIAAAPSLELLPQAPREPSRRAASPAVTSPPSITANAPAVTVSDPALAVKPEPAAAPLPTEPPLEPPAADKAAAAEAPAPDETSGGSTDDAPAVSAAEALDAAIESLEDPADRAKKPVNEPTDGLGHTRLYGLEAKGNHFVYVFDRSASMHGAPLRSAKRELLDSVQLLGDTQQFQIVFYNESPAVFSIAGVAGRIVFGTDANKANAERFVRSMTADGGSAHEEALVTAIRMRPDVIYFLSDAGEPYLDADQLARIERLNSARAQIHAIEFGAGEEPPKNSFLKKLAASSLGKYRYINTDDL